jgi:apolipoprotein N-acyltransferase
VTTAPDTAVDDASPGTGRTPGTGRRDGFAPGTATDDGAPRSPSRLTVGGAAIGGGLLIAASVPPWGWWPLAFAGVAVWDRLVAHQPWKARFARTWVLAAAWLFPALLWMYDLTAPGYVIACAAYAGYFATTVALAPSGPGRWVAFPAAIVLAEQARWSFPFGGVPLATLPMSQTASPFGPIVRVAGPLLLVVTVVLGGMALSAATQKRWRAAGMAAAVVAVLTIVGVLAPHGHAVDTIDVAIVQGGGPQRTRAADTDERDVFDRHLAASATIDRPVDLVLWPENVVNVEGPLVDHEWWPELQQLARQLDAPLSVGIVEGISEEHFLNAQIIIGPEGELLDRYDKVRTVPFGEFVPFRDLLEKVAGGAGLPARDALAGTGPAVVDTPVGRLGVVISWEVFFANRGRDAALNDGLVLTNPTNGSSYWLTQVQTQQVASSRLRALETGRWVTQAAPTGFSAVVDPDGGVHQRTSISEQAVLYDTVELREGSTWATQVGHWPVFLLALAAYPLGWWIERRHPRSSASTAPGAAPSPTGAPVTV